MPFIQPPDDQDEVSNERRSFLKKAGIASSAGILGSIAGCSGSGGDGEGGGGTEGGSGGGTSTETEGSGSSGGSSSAQAGEKVPQLTVTGYPPSNKNIHDTLTLITDRIKELGFDLKYEGLNRSRQLEKTYFNQNYQITSLGYTGRPHRLDPHMLLFKNYHSSQTGDGNYNWTNFENEEVDQLLNEQARTLDRKKRQKLIKEVQAKVMEIPAGEMPIQHDSLVNIVNIGDFEGFVQVAGLGLKNIWTWTQVAPKGDKTTLTAAFPLEIPHLTPLQANEANLITQRITHDRLFRINPKGLPEPWLAKGMEISDNNKQITLSLKKDFKFHDGEPLTADDVKFTIDYLKEWENPFFKSAVTPIKSVQKDSDYQVTINMNQPFAPVKMLTFSRVHILPQHIWKDIPESVDVKKPFEWSPTNSEKGLIGSGPYKFNEWRKGEGISLTANKDHPVGPPNVDGLFLRSIPNPSAMLTAARNRDVDFVIRASAIQTQAVQKAVEQNDHLKMQKTNSVGYDEWSMNTEVKPLDDPAVRGAMSAMIPKKTIAKEIWNNFAIPAHSPTSPVLEFWYNKNVKKWPKEGMEGAKQLLQDAGYQIKDDGIYMPSE